MSTNPLTPERSHHEFKQHGDCEGCLWLSLLKARDQRIAALEAAVAKAEDTLAWIRRKIEVPPDAEMFRGQETIAGRLYVLCSSASGYMRYITAFKCDDKQGEIARQHVALTEAADKITTLEAQLAEARRLLADRTCPEHPAPDYTEDGYEVPGFCGPCRAHEIRQECNAAEAERDDLRTQLTARELRIREELEREYTWVIAALCARSPDRAVTIYFHDVLMLDGAHSTIEKDNTQIDRIVYRLRSR